MSELPFLFLVKLTRTLATFAAIALTMPAALAEPRRKPMFYVGHDVRAYTPMLTYPVEARVRHIQGHGLFLLFVQIRNGAVRDVKIGRSTGSKILDDAAVNNLKRWLFKPPLLRLLEKRHGPTNIPGELIIVVPVNFRL